ncbi:4'-phosphopantetheinyl transferase sfp [Novipirellula aureliae]|uniref:4'-phosphopantetheinyl transferase sfp n=1 Tax=Novipirellula aureliae TaxID=2527966 RepID=A0A5C6EAK9_9BACT|nr:4'-phosphopantetheinyl transferase superfamily protein [Novipirellula aureliae]TWU45555.1 4'-phosphopantetheinyl transferase sfp [Novipirellula aureliae]
MKQLFTNHSRCPSKSVVRIWHATSSSTEPGLVEAFCDAQLSGEERQRAGHFRVATSRNQHIIGRGMVRHLLGHFACSPPIEPRSIELSVLQHGKPFVKHPSTLTHSFNVSHTDGLVLCGIGSQDHHLLGVDVERLERRTDTELADRYFSPPEVEYVRSFADGESRRHAFLRVWTLKEAFIKAIGTGLHTPLADFAFDDIDSSSPKIRILNEELDCGSNWQFFTFRPREPFVAAVAVSIADADTEVSLELQNFDSLVGSGSLD